MTSYNKNDPATIKKMFNNIAKQYDKTNAILSFRMHKHWNRTLINKAILPSQPEVLLDLCCGTGAVAFEYLKKREHPSKVYLLDFSEKMLECAKSQAMKEDFAHHEIHYLQADAQVIPLLNHSVNCVTMAYGIRNIKNPNLCIKDIYRVLKPGGTFGILELTQPTHPMMQFFHSLYLKNLLPILGKLVTSNIEAYQYLCHSIQTFIPPSELKDLMENQGFQQIEKHSLFGGVATVLVGRKSNGKALDALHIR